MQRCIIDIRHLSMYRPLTAPFHGATEMLIKRLAHTLAADNQVHVLCAEEAETYDADGVSWWPVEQGPRLCDTLITVDGIDTYRDFSVRGGRHVLMTGITPILAGTDPKGADSYVVLSKTHGELLRKQVPAINAERVRVLGPGVDILLHPGVTRDPHRLMWANSPDRGLHHMAKLWPEIRAAVPDATIRVCYDVESWVKRWYWAHDVEGEYCYAVQQFLQMPGVEWGVLPYEQVREEMARAALYAYPFDPLVVGAAVHTLATQEAAAEGCALLLTYHEGLPEVFGACADFLNLPVYHDDWLQQIVDVLTNPERQRAMREKSYTWAAQQPWGRWEAAWTDLVKGNVLV